MREIDTRIYDVALAHRDMPWSRVMFRWEQPRERGDGTRYPGPVKVTQYEQHAANGNRSKYDMTEASGATTVDEFMVWALDCAATLREAGYLFVLPMPTDVMVL